MGRSLYTSPEGIALAKRALVRKSLTQKEISNSKFKIHSGANPLIANLLATLTMQLAISH
jgi:hypothetical protein